MYLGVNDQVKLLVCVTDFFFSPSTVTFSYTAWAIFEQHLCILKWKKKKGGGVKTPFHLDVSVSVSLKSHCSPSILFIWKLSYLLKIDTNECNSS